MAASGSSPALAAPVVGIVFDSLPALAAPESAQLRFTLEDAMTCRHTIYIRTNMRHQKATQLRQKGNAATHYYRKIFTMKDGTPLINSLDFSHVGHCRIIRFRPAVRACGTSHQFRHDKRVAFSWRALVAVGLTEAQLFEFVSSPITSVKLMPCRFQPPVGNSDRIPTTVTWSWIFEREDRNWMALEPGLAGTMMDFQVFGEECHPRHGTVVPTPRLYQGERACERSWERVWERQVAILYGGLEDEVWQRHMVEELSSGCFKPEIEWGPHGGWPKWLVWEIEKAMGTRSDRADDGSDIGEMPTVRSSDINDPSDPHPHPSPEEPTWEMPYSDSEEERPLNADDESAMIEHAYIADGLTLTADFLSSRRLLARSIHAEETRTSPHPLIHPQGEPQDGQWGQLSAQWQDRSLVTSTQGVITGWSWQREDWWMSGGE